MASQLGTADLIENAQAKLRWLGHSANDVSKIMEVAASPITCVMSPSSFCGAHSSPSLCAAKRLAQTTQWYDCECLDPATARRVTGLGAQGDGVGCDGRRGWVHK